MRRALFCAALIGLSACAEIHKSPDFVRHNNSRFSEPDNVDVLYFDVYTGAEYPADNEAAESVRMGWLAAWLDQFNLCASGYDVIQRREFNYLENNPGRYDLRYEVQCKVVVPAEASAAD
ncbi:MAG: hypothetical protein ACR2P6_04375 [Gammaproteobacteria bacterium]